MSSLFQLPIPVLTYHRVLPCAGSITIAVDEFERQLQWLQKNGFRTLSGLEFERALRGEQDVGRAIVLTFDDGYFDNLYLAMPLLEKYGMKALLFVITGKTKDRVERSLGAWEEKDDDCYLSWEEIASMVTSGVFEVHSHTHSHAPLWVGEHSAVETRRAIYNDVAASIESLRNRGYTHEIQLAWPWGYFRPEWLDDLEALGVRVCYTMRPGTNFPGADPRLIRRLSEEKFSSNKLLTAACSPFFGVALNAVSRVWGGLRGRP